MLIRSMKPKTLFIISIILLLALFLFLFPGFYFNQLEYKAREIFSSIEDARSIANNDIEQRSGREGGVKSTEEVKNFSVKIAEDLNKVDNLINEHELVINRQRKIVSLLPSKYKEYFNLKKKVFNKYYSSLRKFKALKEYESGIMNVLIKKEEFRVGMVNAGDTDTIGSKELNDLINNYGNARENINKYFKDGFITEDFYHAILADIDANTELYNLFREATEKKYTSQDLEKRMDGINSKYEHEDVLTLFRDSYDKITTVKQQEWSDLFNQADDLTYGALDFYDKNRLAYDSLSLLFSKFNKNYPKNIFLNNNNSKNYEEKKIDLDGDGKEETLRLTYSTSTDEEQSQISESLIAYNSEGAEVARFPDDLPMAMPFTDSAKAYTLNKANKKQFVSYDFIAGPHSADTMFLGLRESNDDKRIILPVCFVEIPQSALDCLFWSGEVGSLIVDDFDNDGFMEVIEMVDEYPKDGSITSDIEEMINEESKDLGQEVTDGMIRITKREQGGRGNRVVWGIYRYNGEYFEKQLGTEYEKYYKLVTEHLRRFYPNYPTIMRKSEMSKDSLEYNNFMRNFWTKR